MAKKTAKKKPKKKIPTGGPFLVAASFCENIVEEKDGVLSAMRLIDTINVWLAPEAPAEIPSAEQPLGMSQQMLVCFKTGDAKLKHKLTMAIHSPLGDKRVAKEQPIELPSKPAGGANIRTNVPFRVDSSGVYWVDVILDGKTMTRSPLNIQIHRTVIPTEQQTKGKK